MSTSKIITRVALILVTLGAFGYYKSTQKPTDTIIATTQTQTINTGSGSIGATSQYIPQTGSVVGRKGSKAGGSHTGIISVISGSLGIQSGSIIQGSFTLAMNSIKVLDINDTGFEDKLQNSFFEAQKYPTSTITFIQSQMSGTQTILSANLTIKDQTHTIQFPIQQTYNNDGTIRIQSSFAIDRTKRGLTMWQGMVNNYIQYTIDMLFIPASM